MAHHIDLAELLATEGDINKVKFELLKSHTLATLNTIVKLISNNNFQSLTDDRRLYGYSPAGDGMGEDNHYLEFCGGRDILEVVTELRELYESLDLEF